MTERSELVLAAQRGQGLASPSVRSSPNPVRELVAVLFRKRRLIQLTFLSTFVGAIVAVVLFGISYEAGTQILVKHRRADEVVSTDSNSRDLTSSTDVPTEREINTEITLLKGGDLMAAVAEDCELDQRENHFWNVLIPGRDRAWRVAKAAKKLGDSLKIVEIPQSNMIEVTYRSGRADLAERVLSDLNKLYLAKHLAVYRPPGVFDFFQQQTQHYRSELDQAEEQLASYDLKKDASDPELDKEILLRKAGEFDGNLRETQAAISQSEKRVRMLKELLGKTPERLTTQMTSGDNPQLLASLKSNLMELETKRTDLLAKYQPTYRLVQEVEKQIANLNATISAELGKPVKQESTAVNPTYDLVKAELVRANEDLTGFLARERATAPVVDTYRQQALLMDRKGIERQELIRNIKAAEQNFMLYVQKQEQARISDEMDKNRILNVAIAEPPSVPAMPVFSPLLLILAGGVLAVMISIATAFFADYLDPSFHTPEEVVQFLGTPVIACFARNGHAPRFGLAISGGGGAGIDDLDRPVQRAGNSNSFLLSNPVTTRLGKFFGFGESGR